MNHFFIIPDKQKDFQGYMVYVLTIIWSVVIGLQILMGFNFFPHLWSRWLILLVCALFITVSSIIINRSGQQLFASWSLIIMLWLFITIPCFTAGGIVAPGILSQMSVILTAGILFGGRGGLVIGLLTMITDFGLAYLQVNDLLPTPSVMHTPITQWIGTIIPFGTIIALQYYATNYLRNGLIALQQEIVKREEAEKSKDEIVYDLGERVKELKTLYSVSRILQDEEALPSNLFQQIVDVLPQGWQFPDITAASISIGGTDYISANYRPSEYFQQAKMKTAKGTKVSIEIVYLESVPEFDEGHFLYEERHLIDMLVDMLKIDLERRERMAERKEADEKIKESEQLLKKITSQVPGNTYLFEIKENGHFHLLFSNRGTDAFNHSYNFGDLRENPEQLKEVLHDDDRTKFDDELKEAFQTHAPISFQYRIVVNGQIRWRWIQAVPEKDNSGKVLWYGATSDITPLIDYITSIEQIIFDIGHVIRRPISSMKGMTKLIVESDLSAKKLKKISQKLYIISEEMDKFINELNVVYYQKRQNTKFKINISSLIDKRGSLFE